MRAPAYTARAAWLELRVGDTVVALPRRATFVEWLAAWLWCLKPISLTVVRVEGCSVTLQAPQDAGMFSLHMECLR